jgi:beta-mannosidase
VRKQFTFIILCCIFAFSDASAQITHKPIHFTGTWNCLDSSGISARGVIPGSLHNDLLRAGIIADPFVGTNGHHIQWVGKKRWCFTSDPFDKLGYSKFSASSVQLYSSWSLNGVELGTTDNAFKPWIFELGESQRPTFNILKINFTPPSALLSERLLLTEHPLPGAPERAVHRMPQYMFGWDWAPKLLDMSVGSLIVPENTCLKHLNLETTSIKDGTASGKVSCHFESDSKTILLWSITDATGKIVARGDTLASNGFNEMRFEIRNPQLWWTHDLGTPYLYELEVVALNDSKLIGHELIKTGIRTLSLNTENGSFRFVLNDIPVYAKGSNFVPTDVLPTRADKREEEMLISSMISANMNMIRIWGGGDYASENLLNLCDSKGVLIWQDFMFACAMYPDFHEFSISIEDEAIYQTLRMRHHPSLAIWCGNNEVSEGWERWGWKDGLSEDEIERVTESYDGVFKNSLRNIVELNDDVPYWESSPMLGRGDPDFKNVGDAHDWGIWHDGYPFDSLWTRVPRFMSEFGFQSFPEPSTFSTVLSSDSVLETSGFRENPEVINHEKHPRGFDIIDSYIEFTHANMAHDSTSLEDWAYLSRVIQAEGISQGVIAGRMKPEHCSGTLVWQLNDCWPGASWSSIDAHGKWKLLHFALKDAFAPTIIHGRWKDGLPATSSSELIISLTSIPGRSNSEIAGVLSIIALGLEGETLYTLEREQSLKQGSFSGIMALDLLPEKTDLRNVFVRVVWESTELNAEGGPAISLMDDVFCVAQGKLDLKNGEINIHSLGLSGQSYKYVISSNVFQKSVELTTNSIGNFDKNGFDLFPGESITVHFTPHDVRIFAPEINSDKLTSTPIVFAKSLNFFSND